jgi:hypothetical protein
LLTDGNIDFSPMRDTSSLCRSLFRNAAHSVLVAGYELYRAEPLFRALADQMAAERNAQPIAVIQDCTAATRLNPGGARMHIVVLDGL